MGPSCRLTQSTAATQSLTHFYSLLSFDTLIVELLIAYLSFVTKSSAPLTAGTFPVVFTAKCQVPT